MLKSLFHHACCCREKTGCLREGQLSRPPELCYFPDKHLTGHVPRGAVGGDMSANRSSTQRLGCLQICGSRCAISCLGCTFFFCSFPHSICSSGSSLRKEKGPSVLLCGLYFYGMLLLKEHSCIAARQTRPSARAQVCSLWVARPYSLKNIQKTP